MYIYYGQSLIYHNTFARSILSKKLELTNLYYSICTHSLSVLLKFLIMLKTLVRYKKQISFL